MKKTVLTALFPALALVFGASAVLISYQNKPFEAEAITSTGSTHDSEATYTTAKPSNINVTDASESTIRSYYSSLSGLSSSELKGDNLLKHLKSVLITNHKYTSYDNVRNWFCITDRDWINSPLTASQLSNYQYITTDAGNGTTTAGPVVHQLYRTDNGEDTAFHYPAKATYNAVEIDREHVWPKSTGFPTDYEYRPAGTDLHHLMLGDGTVNSSGHSNYDYADDQTPGILASSGAVSSNTDVVCKYSGTNYATIYGYMHNKNMTWKDSAGNMLFEPQDENKGDIARACFYMVARYNNLAGVTSSNWKEGEANLGLDENLARTANTDSDAATKVTLASLSTLIRWHEEDPVDDYEIHRNNLIYNNFQYNRNPFIDYPEWVNIAFGSSSSSANVNSDSVSQYGSTGLTLSGSSVVNVGSNATLTPSIVSGYQSGYDSGSEKYVWTSENTSVATVSSTGVVSGVATGTTNIICQTRNSNFYCKKSITVVEGGATTYVSSITLNPTSATIEVGDTAPITATVLPSDATNKNINWSSNNTTVASVSSTGTVTANSTGTAIITATAADGSGIKATCTITVVDENVPVTGVTIDETASVNVGSTVSLTATVSPSNATNKSVSYSSSNTSVAAVDAAGVVTGIAKGSATITVTTDDGGYTATCLVTVTEPTIPTGTDTESVTITYSSFASPADYKTAEEWNATISGTTVSGYGNIYNGSADYMQFNGNNTNSKPLNFGFYNADPFPEKILKVILTYPSNNTAGRTCDVYGGTNEIFTYNGSLTTAFTSNTATSTKIGTATSVKNGTVEMDFSSYNFKYFGLDLSSATIYISSIEVVLDINEKNASVWAQSFLDSTGSICKANGSTTYSSLEFAWTTLSGTYSSLGADAKAHFASPASMSVSSYKTIVQNALARYNFIINRYTSLTDFIFNTSSSARQINESSYSITLNGWAIAFAGLSILSLAAFFIVMKGKKHE